MPRNKKDKVEGNSRFKEAMDEASKDERFSKVLQNPLYRRVPRKEKSVTIDKRFQSMFHDKNFKLNYQMDARGRPIKTTSTENLKRLYNLDQQSDNADEEEDVESNKTDKETDGRGETESVNTDEEDEVVNHFVEPDMNIKSGLTKSELKKLHRDDIDYTRGEGHFVSAESSSDSESSEEEVDEDEMQEWGEIDRDAPRTEEATRRLALCNMDWDRISAADLMVLFHSFLPASGTLKTVKIYTSEFGKQRLAEEELHGPKELVEHKLDDESPTEDGEDEEEGKDFHMQKLRKYQLQRLKYYYAVLEFDSARTAENVYSECDGLEYESSATKIDLRFVPDEMTFEEEPNDICDKIPDPEKYRPRFFTTKALQQLKVDLTWDETDPRRRELTSRLFNPKDKIEDEDIRAYLASSDSESESDDEKSENNDAEDDQKDPILKYKALLQSIEETEAKKKDKDVEMEITWGVGLKQKSEELVKKKLEEKTAENRTPWEEMLAKRREKRKTQKAERKKGSKSVGSSDEDSTSHNREDEASHESDSVHSDDQPFSDDDVEVDLNDPFFKNEMSQCGLGTSKKNKKKKSPAVNITDKESKTQAELELLLMDEGDDKRHHFSLKKIMDAEKSNGKKKKHKKGKRSTEDKGTFEDNFNVNLQDDRFSALFTSHKFNIDPSDPNFKKTKAMEVLIQEKQKRRINMDMQSKAASSEIGDRSHSKEIPPAKKSKAELALLVKSVKSKAGSMNAAKNKTVIVTET